MTDPNLRYYTLITGWKADSRGEPTTGGRVEVEGWVDLDAAVNAADEGGILIRNRQHVTIKHLVAPKVPVVWQGNDLWMKSLNGDNFIKLDDDVDNEMVTLSDVYGDFDAIYPYDAYGGRFGARDAAKTTASYLAENYKIEWGSNFQDVA